MYLGIIYRPKTMKHQISFVPFGSILKMIKKNFIKKESDTQFERECFKKYLVKIKTLYNRPIYQRYCKSLFGMDLNRAVLLSEKNFQTALFKSYLPALCNFFVRIYLVLVQSDFGKNFWLFFHTIQGLTVVCNGAHILLNFLH